jgi:hypothetical protein
MNKLLGWIYKSEDVVIYSLFVEEFMNFLSLEKAIQPKLTPES